MTLPEAITEALPPDDRMRIGTVLTRFPTTVDVQGTAVAASPLASYLPIVGDTVAMIRQDATWLILGRTTRQDTGGWPQYQAGTVDMTAVATNVVTTPVVFATAFRSVPAVATNINSGSGSVVGWISRATSVSVTGFTLYIAGGVNSFTVPVQWQAQEMTQ